MVDIGTPHIAGYSLDGKISGLIMIYKAVCKHFGLNPEFDVDNFLPEPAVGQLSIESNSDDEQKVLADTVRKIYNIREDDSLLRQISEKPKESRGNYFDGLRKNYAVRREFQNTKVIIENKNSSLAKKLEGIGFKTI
jgi:erythronate-4-phosphate dehydrogenase